MKAIVWYGKNDLEYEDVSLQPLKPNEVRIKVSYCGVCGSDSHIIDGKFPMFVPPRIIGHEYSGIVESVGKDVCKIKKGDRVVVDPTGHWCGNCSYCREGNVHFCEDRYVLPGGFAEYTTVLEKSIYVIPNEISLINATFAEPLSCALHAIKQSEFEPACGVYISGAGTMGLLILQLVLKFGAGSVVVSEPKKNNRELAKKLGANLTLDPRTEDPVDILKKSKEKYKVDLIFETSGKLSSFNSLVNLSRKGGKIIIIGVYDPDVLKEFSPYDVYFKELTIKGSFIRLYNFSSAIEWLGKLELGSLISKTYPLIDTALAIKDLKTGDVIKNIIEI